MGTPEGFESDQPIFGEFLELSKIFPGFGVFLIFDKEGGLQSTPPGGVQISSSKDENFV